MTLLFTIAFLTGVILAIIDSKKHPPKPNKDVQKNILIALLLTPLYTIAQLIRKAE